MICAHCEKPTNTRRRNKLCNECNASICLRRMYPTNRQKNIRDRTWHNHILKLRRLAEQKLPLAGRAVVKQSQ